MTGGGADFSFECVGDTGIATTALQSCSDVRFYVLFAHLVCILLHCIVYRCLIRNMFNVDISGMGNDGYSRCTESEA